MFDNIGGQFMSEKDYDEKLLKMLNESTRDTIIKVLKEFLKQIQSFQ